MAAFLANGVEMRFTFWWWNWVLQSGWFSDHGLGIEHFSDEIKIIINRFKANAVLAKGWAFHVGSYGIQTPTFEKLLGLLYEKLFDKWV